jgi:hypothetical protein
VKEVCKGVHEGDKEEIEFRGKTLVVDKCLAPFLETLWKYGIFTQASCCGHGDDLARLTLNAAYFKNINIQSNSITLEWELKDIRKKENSNG